jgi:hypothetical protein
MRDEPLFAHNIATVIGVLTAVDLDNESLLSADKIYDIRPNRFLTDEFESGERAGAKVSPQLGFGVCGISS